RTSCDAGKQVNSISYSQILVASPCRSLSKLSVILLLRIRPPPFPPLFPYTTLFRSSPAGAEHVLRSGALQRAGAEHVLTEDGDRSEEHTSELQSRFDLVCRLLLEKKYMYLHPS